VPLLQQIGIRAWVLSGWENLSGYVYVSFRSIVQKRWSTVHRSGALFIGGTVHRTLLLFKSGGALFIGAEHCSSEGTSTVHRRCCLEAIDRVSFIGGEHDSAEYCCGKHCSPEHCSSAQLLFIYSTVHGRANTVHQSTVHQKVLFIEYYL
jgi:hypothetical protein